VALRLSGPGRSRADGVLDDVDEGRNYLTRNPADSRPLITSETSHLSYDEHFARLRKCVSGERFRGRRPDDHRVGR
jgi:hypothetical protein